MDAKRISLVIIFAALTIVLSPTVSRIAIPSFFPGLYYNLFELPIVIMLLLMGLKPGITVGLIAFFALLPLNPRYIYVSGFLAWLSMIVGVYIGYRLVNRNAQQEKPLSARKAVLYITVGAIILRTVVMAIQNYAMLRLPIIGLELPESYILAIIPPIALFNATQPLVVVPLGYFLARAINSRLKIGNRV